MQVLCFRKKQMDDCNCSITDATMCFNACATFTTLTECSLRLMFAFQCKVTLSVTLSYWPRSFPNMRKTDINLLTINLRFCKNSYLMIISHIGFVF